MTLFHVDRMVVSRSPFGSDLRFVGPHGEFLGMGRPRTHLFGFAGPKGLSLHLFADPAGQEEVLTVHRRAVLNHAAPFCIVDAATGEKCASLQLIVIMGLALPLGENSHPAVQAALTVLGAVVVFSGILQLSRLISEQEKYIEKLQNQLNANHSNSTR